MQQNGQLYVVTVLRGNKASCRLPNSSVLPRREQRVTSQSEHPAREHESIDDLDKSPSTAHTQHFTHSVPSGNRP